MFVAVLPSDRDTLKSHPLLAEKLTPVLAVVSSPSIEHALDVCNIVLERGGLGHTSGIYAREKRVIDAFAIAMRTGRILVNSPTSIGALGGVYNSLTPTFSLGCGSWGGSSTTHNINVEDLLNIKVVAHRKAPPQSIQFPTAVHFNAGAIEHLEKLEAGSMFVVTDIGTEARGAVQQLMPFIHASKVRVFADIRPEPDEAQIRAGVEAMKESSPDHIVAVGGGSVIDAAKVMRLLYEHPDLTLEALDLPFLDPRRRISQFPTSPPRLTLVAIPTTAGTGAEVSPAAVVTTPSGKRTLIDESLAPNVALVDPTLSESMPPALTADTGIDALTHVLEALVSAFASPFSDALCTQSAHLIFENLPRAYSDGHDLDARAAMAIAATLAGMAFSNASVGVNHALAHALGSRFRLAHGRANGVLLAHCLRYNSIVPAKFMPSPSYGVYDAPRKYALLAASLGLGGESADERRERLFERVDRLLDRVAMPRTVRECGVDEAAYREAVPSLAREAFQDPCIRSNPRIPSLTELEALLLAALDGEGR